MHMHTNLCIHVCMLHIYTNWYIYVVYMYVTHFSIRYTEYPTHRQIKLPPGPGSFCSKKPNRVPRRRRRSVSQAAQGLLLRPELAFDTLVTSHRPLVRHLLRKIRVSADAERTRRSSSVSCLFSHPSSATLPVWEAFHCPPG